LLVAMILIIINLRMQKKLISDDLYVEDKLSKMKPITEFTQTIEELEAECDSLSSRIEAEAALRKVGVHVLGKPGGEIMLLAACHGLISVIKFFAPQVNINYKNSFDDNLLHYAAKGGQSKMTLYLLLKGLDPQSQNKFMETPIFLAAEAGHIEVVNILAKDPRTNLEHQDKFGDTVLHFAARDGQLEVTDFLMKKNKKLARIKNQEGKTALTYAIDNA
jgi:ankyrin repeat protein